MPQKQLWPQIGLGLQLFDALSQPVKYLREPVNLCPDPVAATFELDTLTFSYLAPVNWAGYKPTQQKVKSWWDGHPACPLHQAARCETLELQHSSPELEALTFELDTLNNEPISRFFAATSESPPVTPALLRLRDLEESCNTLLVNLIKYCL